MKHIVESKNKVIINALDQSNHNVNNFYESMFRKQINRHNQKSEDLNHF